MENNNILEAEYMSENKSKDYRVLYKYKNGDYGISDLMTKSQAQKYANKCIEYHYECVFVVKEILVLKSGSTSGERRGRNGKDSCTVD